MNTGSFRVTQSKARKTNLDDYRIAAERAGCNHPHRLSRNKAEITQAMCNHIIR